MHNSKLNTNNIPQSIWSFKINFKAAGPIKFERIYINTRRSGVGVSAIKIRELHVMRLHVCVMRLHVCVTICSMNAWVTKRSESYQKHGPHWCSCRWGGEGVNLIPLKKINAPSFCGSPIIEVSCLKYAFNWIWIIENIGIMIWPNRKYKLKMFI